MLLVNSFNRTRICKAPLQETYSEAPPAQLLQNKLVLSNLQIAFSLLLGKRRTSKGSPLQVEGSIKFGISSFHFRTSRGFQLKSWEYVQNGLCPIGLFLNFT